MPDDMTSAFLHKHSFPHWQIASKGTDGKWRIAFGLVKAEIKDPETMLTLDLAICSKWQEKEDAE
jgi:hypothetical protein